MRHIRGILGVKKGVAWGGLLVSFYDGEGAGRRNLDGVEGALLLLPGGGAGPDEVGARGVARERRRVLPQLHCGWLAGWRLRWFLRRPSIAALVGRDLF